MAGTATTKSESQKANILCLLLLLFSRKVVSDSFGNPWIVALQAPLSMGFSRQAYWSGLPFPSPMSLIKKSAII